MQATDAEIDALFAKAMQERWEAWEKQEIEEYCGMVDRMSRRGLLTAHGWDRDKTSTARLRKLAKDRIRANDPHFDIWCGWNLRD